MNNNNINEVITNLYEALVFVRYPGIAHIDLSNFEGTVLAENNRNQLLHWLLIQSVNAVDSTLNIPTAEETSLIKWYSQFGLCTNKNALLGQCPLEEQLDTLVNLTKFIMNVLGADGNETPAGANLVQDILQHHIDSKVNIFPVSCDLPVCNLTYKEAQQYIKNQNEKLKDSENNIQNRLNINEMQDNSQSKSTEIDGDIKINNQTKNPAIYEEFCETFRTIDMCNNSKRHDDDDNDDDSAEIIETINKCVESIHEKFSKINQTLRSKAEISSVVIPVELNIEDSPLNHVIQETAIGLENLSKLHDTNNKEN